MKMSALMCIAACLAPISALCEDSVITSFSGNGAVTWSSADTNGQFTVQWASSLTDTWNSSWVGLYSIAATGGVYTKRVPMYYRISFQSNQPSTHGFTEQFEDDDGWSDKSRGNWITNVPTGQWISQGMLAASHPSRAHSGTRYVSGGDTGGFFELPTTDNPTQIVFWSRGVIDSGLPWIWVQFYDGSSWYTAGSIPVFTSVYFQSVVDVTIVGYPAPSQRLRLNSNGGTYIDDVTVYTAP